MGLEPAITDIEQLKENPALAELLAWNAKAIRSAKFDRDELSIYVARENIRDACAQLKAAGLTDYMSDLTCADYYPREPRFELAYHLLSIAKKERVRLKVQISGDDPVLEWVRGTGLRPILNELSVAEATEFEADYRARLRQAYPKRPYGTVFAFLRTFVVAHKPTNG